MKERLKERKNKRKKTKKKERNMLQPGSTDVM